MNRDVLMTKLTLSDLRTEAEKLIRTGKMPSLSQVLDTIREVKENPKHDAPVIQDALVRTPSKVAP
jgi:HD-like signal output (HDOD) protein